MAISLRWVGQDELDRVARTRLYCYTTAAKDLETYSQHLRDDKRPAELLLAERDGEAIGTATSLMMSMWVRGSRIPCQGVAWVGTIKTHRRGGGPDRGVASRIMAEILRRGRETGQVVSALMPFRASFYEHFGYGVVERRNEWTIPLSILPRGETDGIRFMQPADLPLVVACRRRADEQGQCAIERTPQSWEQHASQWADGYCVVDQSSPGGPVRSWMHVTEVREGESKLVRVMDAVWDSTQALIRQLHFLGSLCDQFSSARIALPADLPLNRLLAETQLEHRPVEHATAGVSPQTRMQVRILDHVRFLEGLTLPAEPSGGVTVAIKESEGGTSVLRLEFEAGWVRALHASGAADIECSDKMWASIACGDLRATTAAEWGLIRVAQPRAARVLDALAVGPLPYCNEYF